MTTRLDGPASPNINNLNQQVTNADQEIAESIFGVNPGTGRDFTQNTIDKYSAQAPDWDVNANNKIDPQEWANFQLNSPDSRWSEGWAADVANKQKLYDAIYGGLGSVNPTTQSQLQDLLVTKFAGFEFADSFGVGAPQLASGGSGSSDTPSGQSDSGSSGATPWWETLSNNPTTEELIAAIQGSPDYDGSLTLNQVFQNHVDEVYQQVYGTPNNGSFGGVSGNSTSGDSDATVQTVAVYNDQGEITGYELVSGGSVNMPGLPLPLSGPKGGDMELDPVMVAGIPLGVLQARQDLQGAGFDEQSLRDMGLEDYQIEWLMGTADTPSAEDTLDDIIADAVTGGSTGGDSNLPEEVTDEIPEGQGTDQPPLTPDPVDQRIIDFATGRGMTVDEAIAHNQNAIDQGGDLNDDGFVENYEWGIRQGTIPKDELLGGIANGKIDPTIVPEQLYDDLGITKLDVTKALVDESAIDAEMQAAIEEAAANSGLDINAAGSKIAEVTKKFFDWITEVLDPTNIPGIGIKHAPVGGNPGIIEFGLLNIPGLIFGTLDLGTGVFSTSGGNISFPTGQGGTGTGTSGSSDDDEDTDTDTSTDDTGSQTGTDGSQDDSGGNTDSDITDIITGTDGSGGGEEEEDETEDTDTDTGTDDSQDTDTGTGTEDTQDTDTGAGADDNTSDEDTGAGTDDSEDEDTGTGTGTEDTSDDDDDDEDTGTGANTGNSDDVDDTTDDTDNTDDSTGTDGSSGGDTDDVIDDDQEDDEVGSIQDWFDENEWVKDLLGIGGAAAAASINIDGMKDAAEAQLQGTREALNLTREQFDSIRGSLAPFIEAATGGDPSVIDAATQHALGDFSFEGLDLEGNIPQASNFGALPGLGTGGNIGTGPNPTAGIDTSGLNEIFQLNAPTGNLPTTPMAPNVQLTPGGMEAGEVPQVNQFNPFDPNDPTLQFLQDESLKQIEKSQVGNVMSGGAAKAISDRAQNVALLNAERVQNIMSQRDQLSLQQQKQEFDQMFSAKNFNFQSALQARGQLQAEDRQRFELEAAKRGILFNENEAMNRASLAQRSQEFQEILTEGELTFSQELAFRQQLNAEEQQLFDLLANNRAQLAQEAQAAFQQAQVQFEDRFNINAQKFMQERDLSKQQFTELAQIMTLSANAAAGLATNQVQSSQQQAALLASQGMIDAGLSVQRANQITQGMTDILRILTGGFNADSGTAGNATASTNTGT